MKTVFKNIFITVFLFVLSLSSFAHFGSKGPYGGGVSVSIVYDSTMYLGTFEGGVYESTNSKLVGWRARPVGLKSGKITALAHTGKHLYAATADSGIFRLSGYVGNDRYWQKKNSGLGNLKVTSLVAVDASTLLAGTNGGGIFKTTNNGDTWVAVNNAVLHHEEITALVKAGTRIIHTSIDGGVYATDDNGASWIDFNDETTDDISATLLSYNTRSDAILVLNRDGLYVANDASTTTSPSYSLAEKGLPGGITINAISNDGLGWYLATNVGVYYSVTGNIDWKPYNFNLPQYNITTVALLYGNIVCGTASEGIYKNNLHPLMAIDPEPTRTWTAINTGFNNLKTYAIATAGEKIIVAATEKGVFVSKDLATSYVRSNNGLADSLYVNDLLFVGNLLFAATKHYGVSVSADTGKTWRSFSNKLFGEIDKLYYKDGMLYAQDFGSIGQTSIAKDEWEALYSPFETLVRSVCFFGGNILIGTDKGIYLINNEKNFSPASDGLTNLNVTSLAYSNGKVFAGTAGSGVFVSDTANIYWMPTTPIAIEFDTTKIGFDRQNIQAMASNLGYVFVSSRGGLVATSDNGATWIQGGTQFNLPSYADVNKIAFTTGSAGRVFVTTPNNGLYSNGLSEMPVLPTGLYESFIAKNNSGIRVSPNPNNGTFNLNFDEKVENVEVVNFAGQSVKQLPSISNQTVNLEVTKGIYLVRAKTVNRVLVQKVIVE